jgi:hypothetical protein
MGTKLSTLWIVVMFNYLYCDVIGLMDADLLRQYVTGSIDGLQITPAFLLGGAALMQIPIWMIFLSRFTRPVTSRRLNIAAGAVMTVVQAATLFAGTPAIYYAFFSAVEIACTCFIVWRAWRWRATADG